MVSLNSDNQVCPTGFQNAPWAPPLRTVALRVRKEWMTCSCPSVRSLHVIRMALLGGVSLLNLCLEEVIFMRWARENVDKIYPFRFHLWLFVMVYQSQVERASAQGPESSCSCGLDLGWLVLTPLLPVTSYPSLKLLEWPGPSHVVMLSLSFQFPQL